MKIGIFGTGTVGQTLSGRLTGLGHEVLMGTRDVEKTLTRTQKDSYGGPSFTEWYADNKEVKLGMFAEAATFGDILINATNGANSIAVLKQGVTSDISGKTLIDVSNPLDFSKGMPPVLLTVFTNTNSLGEEIQRTFPKVNVVKAMNTMWCGLMVNPEMLGGGNHDVFICGNDVGAKNRTSDLLRQFGWKDEHIIDLGDITAARGTEMILPIWLRLMSAFGSAAFNFKVVR